MPFITTRNATLHYTVTGQGPVALLIQGVGAVGDVWRPQVEALSGEFTCVTFDNRGIGRSAATGALSIEDMALDALAVLEAIGCERAHVAGHSMGGVIAQAVALVAAHRVKSLALLCTFRRGSQATALSPAMIWRGLRTRIGTRAMRRRAFLEMILPDHLFARVDISALAAQYGALFKRDLADQPSIIMRQLRALAAYDAGAALASLATIPTVVVSARHDRIASQAFGRALADAIPGAEFVLLNDAGHAAPIHVAHAVNALLVAHWLAAVD